MTFVSVYPRVVNFQNKQPREVLNLLPVVAAVDAAIARSPWRAAVFVRAADCRGLARAPAPIRSEQNLRDARDAANFTGLVLGCIEAKIFK